MNRDKGLSTTLSLNSNFSQWRVTAVAECDWSRMQYRCSQYAAVEGCNGLPAKIAVKGK
jgi:hypothetical protein